MEYRRFGSKVVLRIDRGEEVVSTILQVCEKEQIRCASVLGIGAADHVEFGLYNVAQQHYNKTELNEPLEITSLAGSITQMDGKVYQHLHINVADENGAVHGGHLNSARISGTCEIVLDLIDGEVGRRKDWITGTGLNLFAFD
ncbi:MAG: DNA-binding protein [Lachnospiraceae bacterium]|nr:DNA-binding protein [Lachnospiraceae bacterium]